MKKKILVKLISVATILGLIKTSIVLAKENAQQQQNAQQQDVKQQQNAQQQEKKFSPEQEKEKEQNIKTIKEAFNKLKSLEKQMQEKLKNMFKNFKKEDFEVKNYDLEVFKKNNAPILIYTHKKTGAKVYFNLVLDKDKLKQKTDQLIFKAPTKNDKGLIHFTEHCVTNFVDYFTEKLQISGNDINAVTTPDNLGIISRVEIFGLNEKLEKEFVEKLTTELNNPYIFEKGDKTFEIEKRRILNELKDKRGEGYSENEIYDFAHLRLYKVIGKISELEKAKSEDLKYYYEKYINPSNCFLIKNVLELNPKKIKNYLNMWHEKYFSHYDKKQVTGNNSELKNKEKYFLKSWPKDSQQFVFFDEKNNKKQNFKYKAMLENDLTKFNLKQTLSLGLVLEPFKEEIEKLAKDLGYDRVIFGGGIKFFGNKKELFSQKALEENYKKIMNFVENKLKNLNEEDFFYLNYYNLKNFNKFQINELNLKNALILSDPDRYIEIFLASQMLNSFNKTAKLIDEKYFLVNKNNELENEEDLLLKYAKENIDIYGKLAEIGPKYITVIEQNDKTVKQTFEEEVKKYEYIPRVAPIKLKDEKSKELVKNFAKILLNKALTKEFNEKRGLMYGGFSFSKKVENDFVGLFDLNKDSVKPLEDYMFKNFDEIMKNVEIKNDKLDELKKQYKEKFDFVKKQYDEYFKNEEKIIKDFENYIKTGKIDENSVLQKKDLKIKDFLFFYPFHLTDSFDKYLFAFYEDSKDYINCFEKEIGFLGKYAKKVNEKVTPEFAKDFLENFFKPTLKKLKKTYKLAKANLKELDNVKFSEVKDLIKTAYLVKDKEEIKKFNKNIKQRKIMLEKIQEDLKK